MSGITVNYGVLNQRATPAFFADTFANRPAFGVTGRVFISTDTLDLYRDTGTSWVLLSPSSTGTITGTGAAGQVTYFTGATSIGGNNNLFWDTVNFRLGVNTNTPGAPIDVHGANALGNVQINTTALNDNYVNYLVQGTSRWRAGISYNTGLNDYSIFDVTNSLQRFSIKNTGQTTIGPQVTTSGTLVVNNANSDNHLVVIGANGPSIRLNNAGTGATRQIGIGLATTTNNFIQGTTGGEYCIFNANTTISPILIGIWNGVNIGEIARYTTSFNYLIGSSTDTGERLQVTGNAKVTGTITAGTIVRSGGTSAQFLMADGSVTTGGGGTAGDNIGLVPSQTLPGSVLFYLNNPYYWNGYVGSAGSQQTLNILNQANFNSFYLAPLGSATINFANFSGLINSNGNFGAIPFQNANSGTVGSQDSTIVNFTTSAFTTFTNVEYPEQGITNQRCYSSSTTTENCLFTNNTLRASVMISFLRKGNSGGFCWYLFNSTQSGTRFYNTSKTTASADIECFDMPCIGQFNGTLVYSFFNRTNLSFIYTTNGTTYTNVTGGASSAIFTQAITPQYNFGAGNCVDTYQVSPFGFTSWGYSTNGGQSYTSYTLPTAPPSVTGFYPFHCIDFNGSSGSPRWAYCGANGTLYYSSNLSTGFTASATTGVGQRNIFFVNGFFFALTPPGQTATTTILYSSDAITWSTLTVASGQYSFVTYSVAAAQYFFISGSSSTNTHYCSSTFTGVNSIVSSTAGGGIFSPASHNLGIWVNGDQFAYVDNAGQIRWYPGTGVALNTVGPTAAARTTGSPAKAVPNTVQYLYQKMN